MTKTSQRKLDSLRLAALAHDIGLLLTECEGELSEDDSYLLCDLRSQLRGMSALLPYDNVHWAVNVILKSAMDEYVRISLKHGPQDP